MVPEKQVSARQAAQDAIAAARNVTRRIDNGDEPLEVAEVVEEEITPDLPPMAAIEQEPEVIADLPPMAAVEQEVAPEPQPVVESAKVIPFEAKFEPREVDVEGTLKDVVAAIEDGNSDVAVAKLQQAITDAAVTPDDINQVFKQRDVYDAAQVAEQRRGSLQAIENDLKGMDEYKGIFADEDLMNITLNKAKSLNGTVPDSELFKQALDYTNSKFGAPIKQETTRLGRKAAAPGAVVPRATRKAAPVVEVEKSREEKRADYMAQMRSKRNQ